jgi:hypothetical protein
MARLLFFVPAQVGVVDNASNGLSVINIIESIGLPGFPGVVGGFFLIAWWHSQPGDQRMVQRVELRDPGNPRNSPILRIDTPFAFTANQNSMRILNVAPPSQIPTPGNYQFQVYITREGSNFPTDPSAIFPVTIGQTQLPGGPPAPLPVPGIH